MMPLEGLEQNVCGLMEDFTNLLKDALAARDLRVMILNWGKLYPRGYFCSYQEVYGKIVKQLIK